MTFPSMEILGASIIVAFTSAAFTGEASADGRMDRPETYGPEEQPDGDADSPDGGSQDAAPSDGASDALDAGADAAAGGSYAPRSDDTLVLMEVSGGAWTGSMTETRLPGTTVVNWNSPSWPSDIRSWKNWKSSAQESSAIPGVIVMHETGLDETKYTRDDTGIHFLVARNGTVYQAAPHNLRYKHSPLVMQSIGIEVANGSNDINMGLCAASGTPADSVKVPWVPCYQRNLAIPSRPQAEAIYALVTVLAREYSIPTTFGNQLTDDIFLWGAQQYSLGGRADAAMAAWHGVVSHGILQATGISPGARHNDGGSENLYLKYRFDGKTHGYAYCKMQEVLQTASVPFASIPSSLGIPSATYGNAVFLRPYDLNEEEGPCYGQ